MGGGVISQKGKNLNVSIAISVYSFPFILLKFSFSKQRLILFKFFNFPGLPFFFAGEKAPIKSVQHLIKTRFLVGLRDPRNFVL